jgi:peroxiredoxin
MKDLNNEENKRKFREILKENVKVLKDVLKSNAEEQKKLKDILNTIPKIDNNITLKQIDNFDKWLDEIGVFAADIESSSNTIKTALDDLDYYYDIVKSDKNWE